MWQIELCNIRITLFVQPLQTLYAFIIIISENGHFSDA